MRCYQLHHKHAHLLEFDHECSACGLCFLSRYNLQTHNCVPRRRRVNIKKREVLAARMQEKMRLTSKPYFVFVDSDSQLMAYAGDSKGSIKDVSFEQSLSSGVDSMRADEAGSNNSVDRLENEDTCSNGFLQNDLFHLTENSAVLSCLPKCERELLRSADIETLSTELEMDVCSSLELQDDGAVVERPAAVASDADDDNLLTDVGDPKIPAENGIIPDVDDRDHSSTVPFDAEPTKSADIGSEPSRGQQWPMAMSLGNGRLQCNVCLKELRVANYYPHMRRVHKMPSSQSQPIVWKVCDRCGYQCQDNYKLRRHAMKHSKYGKLPRKPLKLDSTVSTGLH